MRKIGVTDGLKRLATTALVLAAGVHASEAFAQNNAIRTVPVTVLAEAWRQMGDLHRDGRLTPTQADVTQSFLLFATDVDRRHSIISILPPDKMAPLSGYMHPDGEKARTAYQVAGDMGDPEALVRLGDLYRAGTVVPRNYAIAMTFYRKAEAMGYVGSHWRIAEMLLRGEGVPVDIANARIQLETAAATGDNTTTLMLGDYNASGELGGIDAAAAIKAYEKVRSAGDVRGATRLANLYYDGTIVSRDPAKAFGLYKEAADKGDQFATIRYAQMMLAGDGVAADIDKGVGLLEGLAANQDASAKVALADFLSTESQSGKRHDAVRAYGLYKDAAAAGSRTARLRSAEMLARGEGVAADVPAAMADIASMAKDGYAAAALLQGDLLVQGIAGKPQPADIIAAYELSVMLGDERGAVRLGDFYSDGVIVPKALDRAYSYYREAARSGDLFARVKADVLAAKGVAGTEAAAEGLKDVGELARSGMVEAIVAMGDFARTGIPGLMERNEKLALENYLAASAKGNQTASLRAGEILVNGQPQVRDVARGLGLLKAEADKGSIKALITYGDALVVAGPDVPPGMDKPLDTFQKAADLGDMTALLRIGDLYRDGKGGVSVDGDKAVQYYLKAAGIDAAAQDLQNAPAP